MEARQFLLMKPMLQLVTWPTGTDTTCWGLALVPHTTFPKRGAEFPQARYSWRRWLLQSTLHLCWAQGYHGSSTPYPAQVQQSHHCPTWGTLSETAQVAQVAEAAPPPPSNLGGVLSNFLLTCRFKMTQVLHSTYCDLLFTQSIQVNCPWNTAVYRKPPSERMYFCLTPTDSKVIREPWSFQNYQFLFLRYLLLSLEITIFEHC